METINVRGSGPGHNAPITGVAVSADGQMVATSSYDGTLKVWDLDTLGTVTEKGTGRHARLVNAVAWSPTGKTLASASADKTVAVWDDTESGLTLRTVLSRHTDDVNSVAWLPDGQRFACVSEDGKATAWDSVSGEFLGEISAHRAHCMMVAVSSTGYLATVGEDGQVTVLSPNFDIVSTARFDCSIEGCAWSPDSTRLATARDDGRIDLFDIGLQVLASTTVSTSAARSVSWSPTGERLAVGSYEGGIQVLDTASLQQVLALNHRNLWTRSIAYAAADRIVAGGFGSQPLVFDTSTGVVVNDGGAQLRGPNALLAHGNALFVGTDSGEVLRWATPGADPTRVAQVRSPILSLAAAKDTIFAGTYGGDVIRLSAHPSRPEVDDEVVVGRAGAPVPSLCLVDGTVVAGTYNGELVGFDPGTMRVVDRSQAHSGSIKSLAIVKGARFAAASTDRTVSVGTITDRTPILQHGNLINDVAVAGGFVASGSRDRTVRVARLVGSGDGSVAVDVRVLAGPDESVKCVGLAVHGDQVIVLAGSYDFRLYAWDVNFTEPSADRYAYRVLHTFTQAVSTISTGLDGTLYAAGWDGHIIKFTPRITADRLELDQSTIVETCLV